MWPNGAPAWQCLARYRVEKATLRQEIENLRSEVKLSTALAMIKQARSSPQSNAELNRNFNANLAVLDIETAPSMQVHKDKHAELVENRTAVEIAYLCSETGLTESQARDKIVRFDSLQELFTDNVRCNLLLLLCSLVPRFTAPPFTAPHIYISAAGI